MGHRLRKQPSWTRRVSPSGIVSGPAVTMFTGTATDSPRRDESVDVKGPPVANVSLLPAVTTSDNGDIQVAGGDVYRVDNGQWVLHPEFGGTFTDADIVANTLAPNAQQVTAKRQFLNTSDNVIWVAKSVNGANFTDRFEKSGGSSTVTLSTDPDFTVNPTEGRDAATINAWFALKRFPGAFTGRFFKSGARIKPVDSTQRFEIEAGTLDVFEASQKFVRKTITAASPAVHDVMTQDGTVVSTGSDVDTTVYDLANVVTALTGGSNAVVDQIWVNPDTNNIVRLLGQRVYTSLADAQSKYQSNVYDVVKPAALANYMLAGIIYRENGELDLANRQHIQFQLSGNDGEIGVIQGPASQQDEAVVVADSAERDALTSDDLVSPFVAVTGATEADFELWWVRTVAATWAASSKMQIYPATPRSYAVKAAGEVVDLGRINRYPSGHTFNAGTEAPTFNAADHAEESFAVKIDGVISTFTPNEALTDWELSGLAAVHDNWPGANQTVAVGKMIQAPNPADGNRIWVWSANDVNGDGTDWVTTDSGASPNSPGGVMNVANWTPIADASVAASQTFFPLPSGTILNVTKTFLGGDKKESQIVFDGLGGTINNGDGGTITLDGETVTQIDAEPNQVIQMSFNGVNLMAYTGGGGFVHREMTASVAATDLKGKSNYVAEDLTGAINLPDIANWPVGKHQGFEVTTLGTSRITVTPNGTDTVGGGLPSQAWDKHGLTVRYWKAKDGATDWTATPENVTVDDLLWEFTGPFDALGTTNFFRTQTNAPPNLPLLEHGDRVEIVYGAGDSVSTDDTFQNSPNDGAIHRLWRGLGGGNHTDVLVNSSGQLQIRSSDVAQGYQSVRVYRKPRMVAPGTFLASAKNQILRVAADETTILPGAVSTIDLQSVSSEGHDYLTYDGSGDWTLAPSTRPLKITANIFSDGTAAAAVNFYWADAANVSIGTNDSHNEAFQQTGGLGEGNAQPAVLHVPPGVGLSLRLRHTVSAQNQRIQAGSYIVVEPVDVESVIRAEDLKVTNGSIGTPGQAGYQIWEKRGDRLTIDGIGVESSGSGNVTWVHEFADPPVVTGNHVRGDSFQGNVDFQYDPLVGDVLKVGWFRLRVDPNVDPPGNQLFSFHAVGRAAVPA